MNRTSLFSALALLGAASFTARALEPQVLDNQRLKNISPNGQYVASLIDGEVTVTNLRNGENFIYTPDKDEKINFNIGYGNAWSATGIMVGGTTWKTPSDFWYNNYLCTSFRNPAYWQDGEWYDFPNPDKRFVDMACISSDGRVAVGAANVVAADHAPRGLKQVTAVWTASADGIWSDPEILPYPTEDFAGRPPRGVAGICISDDGSKILAQIIDQEGLIAQPLMYTKDADGDWSFEKFGGKLINPDDRIIPYVMPEPEYPDPAEYISDPEKRAVYEEEMRKYYAGEINEYPDEYEYLSEEDKKKYDEAYAQFLKDRETYYADYDKFYDVYLKVMRESTDFTHYNGFMTPDGSLAVFNNNRYVVGSTPGGGQGEVQYIEPNIFNMSDGHRDILTIPEVVQLVATGIAADGTLFAFKRESKSSIERLDERSFVKPAGKDWMRTYDYLLATVDEKEQRWLKLNLLHTYTFTDYLNPDDTKEYVDEPVLAETYCTPDLKVVAATVRNCWNNNGIEDYSYVIPTTGAIETPDVADIEVVVTPETGSTVKSLSEIKVTFPASVKSVAINEDMAEKGVETFFNDRPVNSPVAGDDNTVFTFAEPIANQVQVVFRIKEGYYLLVMDDDTKALSPAIETIVSVFPYEVADVKYSTVPAAEGTVAELCEFSVVFDDVKKAEFVNKKNVGISLAYDNRTLAFNKDFKNEGSNVTTMKLNEPIEFKTATEVAVLFPEATYLLTLGDDSKVLSPEVKFTFTGDKTLGADNLIDDGMLHNVFTTTGVLVLRNASVADLNALASGIYIVDGRKYIKR